MDIKILSRKDAFGAGENHYFTGRPCIHGHIAQRYVASGACMGCISRINAAARETKAMTPNPRRDVAATLHQIRVRLHYEDRQVVFDTAIALTLARHPVLSATDVVGKMRAISPSGGCALYVLAMDPVDVPMVRIMENALHAKRAPDMNKIREQIYGPVIAQASQGRDNQAGEWTFI